MSSDERHLDQHYHVLMRLAKSESWGRGDLDPALREVTEAAAHTMGIERVNVWLFDEGRTQIRCLDHYQRSTGEHSSGAVIAASDFPNYFKVLDEERAIVANDARSDPRTREFAEEYLDVHGITSMLDAPLHAGGEVVGIVCHEHVGEPRVWTADEQQFAASLADFAALAIESWQRKQAQQALEHSEKRTREIISHALDAIIIVDEDGVIKDWNPRAETIFGWQRRDAVGKTLHETVIPDRYHEEHRRGMRRFLETGHGPIINKRIEIEAVRADGREFPVELSISAVRIGSAWIFSAFVRDITQRRRAAEQIRALNAELEQRVLDRTAELRTTIIEKERLVEELRASSVELLQRFQELERKTEMIRDDLERAQIIQRSLLPAQPPRLEGAHVQALYRPGMNVGGDLYDIVDLGDSKVAFYVADAAGHGVTAAMVSVLFKQRLETCNGDGTPLRPSEVLRRVNGRLLSDDVLTQDLFLTAGYVLFDTSTGELHAASAGHPPMLLRRTSGETVLLERTGPALGISDDAVFEEHALTMNRGDRFVVFTDGLTLGIEPCGRQEITDLLVPALTGDSRDGPYRLRGLFQDTEQRTKRGGGSTERDDVTLLVLEVEGGASHLDNNPSDDIPRRRTTSPGERTQEQVLWMARGDEDIHLEVRGRGTWAHCAMFRSLASEALQAGKRLTIDLAACTYLDSAFLGTIHEVVTTEGPHATRVSMPCETVRAFFVELGLGHVMAAIRDTPTRPPREPLPVTHEAPMRESQLRLLRAHEILSELSDENRERFCGVVELLRAELGQDGTG